MRQTNRQLSGRILPPLVIRAVGAHLEMRARRLSAESFVNLEAGTGHNAIASPHKEPATPIPAAIWSGTGNIFRSGVW
jgi:hypothetical protein